MFSKAKRFDANAIPKGQSKEIKKVDMEEKQDNKSKMPAKNLMKVPPVVPRPKPFTKIVTPLKPKTDVQSQCSSKSSVKSFVTPKPVKSVASTKLINSLKKCAPPAKTPSVKKPAITSNEIIKEQEVEIRNKDQTIEEYNKQIEELKNDLSKIQKQLNETTSQYEVDKLNHEMLKMALADKNQTQKEIDNLVISLKNKINELEQQCNQLEQELSLKQVDLNSVEEIITIRDSLCKDLQEKLTNAETTLEETTQRLEMVKGHHALALEANESIRREYKAEIETLKSKLEEEKQAIITRSRADQENVKTKYMAMINSIKNELIKEKEDIVQELQEQMATKESEMKAKIEQIEETAHEKLRLCEIQFEERSQNIQDHWNQQQKKIQILEKEIKELNYQLSASEENNLLLQKEIGHYKLETDNLKSEKQKLIQEVEELREESKTKFINFENEINKLTVLVDKVTKDKNKYELSLTVTRDIVQVLTMRLRDSDNELEVLEGKVQELTTTKESLENEFTTYKNTLNNTVMECNEYKEALVNILKSKANLAKEHTRMMEHNVTLIESLQNVEKEAYRELGTIKNELLEDVELLKKESKSQIQMLQEEVEKKRMLCELATEHAGQATVAAEQSRVLLSQAANEITRLENENQRLLQQIQDQQSLVVELSLLRQENEELSMSVAKHSSLLEKMKKDMDDNNYKPKSPSVVRKMHKAGKENIAKENMQIVISPLRERNH